MELQQWVEGYFTFSKWDILCNLEGTIPEARSKDPEVPQECTIAQLTTTNIRGVESHPATTQESDDTILVTLGCTPDDEAPPAEPTTSSGSAKTSPRGNTMIPLAEVDTDTPKDLTTIQAASPAKAENWVVPTMGSVDKLAGPPTPSNHIGEEKQCMLTVTASIGRLNLEATGVMPRNTMIALVGRVAFGNSHMVATLLGPP